MPEPVWERGNEVFAPGGEGADLDVVYLDGVVGEAEDKGGGMWGGEEGEGVDWVREGGEDALMLNTRTEIGIC